MSCSTSTAQTRPKHLKEYTDLIYDSEVYPVILDSKDRVMSLPPIINSDFSKISQDTRDIFIEITAVDENKANIVLNTLVAMFSCYCETPYHVEAVEVEYEATGRKVVTPNMNSRPMSASVRYLNAISGLDLNPDKICAILTKMMLSGTYDEKSDTVTVSVPPTRSDVLHACDVAEDMAIAYGYNNLEKRPLTTITVGRQQPINQLTDLLRYVAFHVMPCYAMPCHAMPRWCADADVNCRVSDVCSLWLCADTRSPKLASLRCSLWVSARTWLIHALANHHRIPGPSDRADPN